MIELKERALLNSVVQVNFYHNIADIVQTLPTLDKLLAISL